MRIEIETLEAMRAQLATGSLARVVVQGLDLREVTEALLRVDAEGAVFLGCELTEPALAHVLGTGGLCFPPLPDLPYHPYRPRLYEPLELMEGYRRGDHASARQTLDARIGDHFRATRQRDGSAPIVEALAQRLHDHAVDDALHDFLHDGERRVVAIMGGHAMGRGDRDYRRVAQIAHRLTRLGYLMASGGGPGAMEATHLGAFLSSHEEGAIDEALRILAPAPTYRDNGWFDTALDVRERLGGTGVSLGIPTWFYGQEPPNLFASHIAKYFSNSLREDGLLAIATHGVVYAPGSAGTIQEVFMDAAQNHYLTFGVVSPMVFLGVQAWTRDRPVLALLQNLAEGRAYADAIAVTDSVDEVVDLIRSHPPFSPG